MHGEICDRRRCNKGQGRHRDSWAIFTTMAGELCYAVEHKGALDFVEEAKLSNSPKTTCRLGVNAFAGAWASDC